MFLFHTLHEAHTDVLYENKSANSIQNLRSVEKAVEKSVNCKKNILSLHLVLFVHGLFLLPISLDACKYLRAVQIQ